MLTRPAQKRQFPQGRNLFSPERYESGRATFALAPYLLFSEWSHAALLADRVVWLGSPVSSWLAGGLLVSYVLLMKTGVGILLFSLWAIVVAGLGIELAVQISDYRNAIDIRETAALMGRLPPDPVTMLDIQITAGFLLFVLLSGIGVLMSRRD